MVYNLNERYKGRRQTAEGIHYNKIKTERDEWEQICCFRKQ